MKRIREGDLSDKFSPRDVYYRKHWSKLDTAEKVNEAIKILEDFGWIKTKIIRGMGRPTTEVIIHPQIRGKK